MSDLYKTAYRGYLIDHHSPAPPVITLDKLDPAEYEAFFAEANLSTLLLYTKDHWGYSYYDTAVGTRHPALDRDWILQVSEILKRRGIEFTAYYSVEYDTLAPRLHPEWAVRDAQGRPMALTGRIAKWGVACYETGYRQYVLEQLKEVVAGYRPDSLFLDIFGKTLCYCDACRAKFKARFGYDLPLADMEIRNEYAAYDFGEKGRDVNRFLEQCAQEMLEDVIGCVKAIDPTIKVSINFAALYPKAIRDRLDYQFTEPWAGNWLSAAYARDTAMGQYPQLGPGDVSEVYNYRQESIYRLAAAQITAQGCRCFMYSGSQHVDGTLEHVEAQRVGSAYADVARYEELLGDRSVLADVAIVQSDASKRARSGSEVIISAIGRCKRADPHRNALLGAMKLCDHVKYTWQLIPEQAVTAEGLAGKKAVILAGVYHVTDTLAAVLDGFVRGGGVLIMDGASGLYTRDGELLDTGRLDAMQGAERVNLPAAETAAPWTTYITPLDSAMWQYIPETTPPIGKAQYKLRATTASALGVLTPPCVPVTDTTWVNWWSPPPTAAPGDIPAVLLNACGSGKVLTFAFDFFHDSAGEFHLNPDIFRGVMEMLVPRLRVRLETDLPASVGFVAYERGNELIVHSLSHLAEQTNGAVPAIPAGTLHIDEAWRTPMHAETVFPERRTLPIEWKDGKASIPLPDVSIHQVVRIVLDT